MNYFKLNLIFALVWSLLLPPEVFAKSPNFGTEELREVVEIYNKNSTDVDGLIKSIGQVDSYKAAELKSIVDKEKIDLKFKIPKLEFEDNSIVLNTFGKHFIFKNISLNEIEISLKNKAIVLNKKMSAIQMRTLANQLINEKEKEKYSILNLFIPNAYSIVVLDDILVALAVVFASILILNTFSVVKQSIDARKIINSLDEWCKSVDGQESMRKKPAEIDRAITKLKDLKNRCNVPLCVKEIPNTIACFESVRNGLPIVDQSSRSHSKPAAPNEINNESSGSRVQSK